MEWLRAVDLAEYAPNLRGSGVHGGLIVSHVNFELVYKRDSFLCDHTSCMCLY